MEKKYQVPALSKAFHILDLIADNSKKLNLTDLVSLTKLNKSTVYAILKSLEADNYIKKNVQSTYELGYKLGLLGSIYFQQVEIINEFQTFAAKSVSATNEIYQLSVLNDTNIFCLSKVEPINSRKILTSPGMHFPAHASAMGKVLLSKFENSEIRNFYYNKSLEKLTPNTVSNLEDLIKQVDHVRKQGYFQEFEETLEDLTCIAAPIFNHENNLIAAVSTSLSVKKFKSNENLYTKELLNLSNSLSLRFGFSSINDREEKNYE